MRSQLLLSASTHTDATDKVTVVPITQNLASLFEVYFKDCGEIAFSSTSKICNGDSSYFEVNRSVVCSMHAIGQGYSDIERFFSIINMPKPMTKNNYNKHVNSLCTAISQVVEDTMMDTAK